MKRMIKYIVCASLICAFCGTLFTLHNPPKASAANIEISSDKIRVFIGSTDSMDVSEAKSYTLTQDNLLSSLASEQPLSEGAALITFDDFLSVQETSALLTSASSIKTIYMWIPEKEGRAIIDIENNNISDSIDTFFDSINIDELPDSDYKSDMLDLHQNYGIFAAEITGQYELLNSMNHNSISTHNIMHVDVLYNEEAASLAKSTQKPISYICIPEKPDGTK